MLRAPRSGVVTAVRFEVGQVVAEGQPVVSIANEGEPEIVVDVPEDHLAAFKPAHYRAWLASAPDETFEVCLRELSPQAAAQTRTFRARLKPATPRPLPLGATATLVVERPVAETPRPRFPPSRSRRARGSPRCGSCVGRTEPVGTVELVGVEVHGYRNDEVLVSGPPAGELVVAPACRRWRRAAGRALRCRAQRRHASRPPDEILQPHRVGARPPRHRPVPDPRDRGRRRAGLHEARAARGPELLRAVDDGDGDLARRHRAADPGRGAEPHGEEVRAARPLREGRDVRAPGLRRHDDHRERRHLEGGPARGVVPGAQEVQRHQARAARRRHRPDLQRRIRRRHRAAVCRQGRRRQPRGALRRLRGHQAAPAEGADGQEGRRLRQAGQEGVRRVLARAARRARHHAAHDCRKPQEPEQRAGGRPDRHARRPRVGPRQRPVREPGRYPQRADRRRRPGHQARRLHDDHARLRGSADLHRAPQRPAGADARHRDDQRRQHRRPRQGDREGRRQESRPSCPTASSSSASPTSRPSSANRSGNSNARCSKRSRSCSRSAC